MKLSQLTLQEWRRFCAAAHAREGKKYGKRPYLYHLDRVEEALVRFGFFETNFRRAAFGHDLIEDTRYKKKLLLSMGIDHEVLAGIWGVTDEPGATRQIRKHRTIGKIGRKLISLAVKLADRIANVEENVRSANLKTFLKYKREHAELSTLRRRYSYNPRLNKMWAHLDWLFANGEQMILLQLMKG